MTPLLEQEVDLYIQQVNDELRKPCPEKEYKLMQLCEEHDRKDLKEKLIDHMKEQVDKVSQKILNGDYN